MDLAAAFYLWSRLEIDLCIVLMLFDVGWMGRLTAKFSYWGGWYIPPKNVHFSLSGIGNALFSLLECVY